MRSINMIYVVRPHPTKPKSIVRPVRTLALANQLTQQHKEAKVVEPKRNISSGEDVCFQ